MKTQITFSLLVACAISLSAADAPSEKDFVKNMKAVGKATKGFKANFEGKNAAAIEKDAATTADAYKVLSAFFKNRKNDDAVKWSDDSAAAATAAAAAAKAGDWDKVKSEWSVVGKNCKACHDKYREKLDDGSYRIK